MPVFTPPTTEGNALGEDHPLLKFYGAWEQGQTVWKDADGNWHTNAYPYLGGATHTTTDRNVVTTTDPDEGLATAQEVYLGGHEYPITDAKADELRAAGFVVGGHWDAEEARWINFAINSQVNKEYKGGDSCASLLQPNGTSLWVFADNFIGTCTADGFYQNVLPTRNALIVRDAAGVLTQSFPEGNHPAWTDPTPNHWWWPIDLINDGSGTSGTQFVSCWEVTVGVNYGHLVRNQLLELGLFGFRANTYSLETNGTFFIESICKDDSAGYHYILGLEFDAAAGGYDTYASTTLTYTRLARCPIGSLATLSASIQYWDGSSWQASPSVPRMKDARGNVIEGNTDLTKVGSTWVLISQNTRNAAMTMWTAPSPTGPWERHFQTGNLAKNPSGGLPTSPSEFAYYLPKFHEHLNPDSSHLVATYNRNIFTLPGLSGTPPLTSMHVSTFCPQFVYLPAP